MRRPQHLNTKMLSSENIHISDFRLNDYSHQLSKQLINVLITNKSLVCFLQLQSWSVILWNDDVMNLNSKIWIRSQMFIQMF